MVFPPYCRSVYCIFLHTSALPQLPVIMGYTFLIWKLAHWMWLNWNVLFYKVLLHHLYLLWKILKSFLLCTDKIRHEFRVFLKMNSLIVFVIFCKTFRYDWEICPNFWIKLPPARYYTIPLSQRTSHTTKSTHRNTWLHVVVCNVCCERGIV